nr:hypothetical protein [Tanacetum cinerariifolium]
MKQKLEKDSLIDSENTRSSTAANTNPPNETVDEEDFKKLLMKEYCPDDEFQKLELEFWNHKMAGSDIGGYTARFYELARAVDKRPRPTCYECGDPNQFRRNYLRMNRATISGGNHPNPVLAIKGNTNQGNNRNRVQDRGFGLGVAEAIQDPNVVTGTFSLNDHFVTVLFDSDAEYSFISTNFLPLINMKPSVIILGYEIKIASDVKVETNKIIRGCKLELEGHTFNIDLIRFGYGSFDVIVGMDWLLKLRAKILKTMKVNKPKLEDIPIVCEFPNVFLKDLSSLPPSRDVKFCKDLIPRAMPVAKSPYHLAPMKMQELSNQLIELHEKAKLSVFATVGIAQVDDKLTKEELMGL